MKRFKKSLKNKFNQSIDSYLKDYSLKEDLRNQLNITNTPNTSNEIKNKFSLSLKFSFAGIAIAIIILIGIFIPTIININKNIPTYQSMEVINSSQLQNIGFSERSVTDYQYYAQSSEKIVVKINITNPKSYEILSLKLNNVLYQSYQFMYGSNSEEIFIEFDVQGHPGVQEITIDQIKYVKGTSIKNAKYEGNRTIKIAVEYTDVPMIEGFNYQINLNKIDFNFKVIDKYKISENIMIYLFDGSDNLIRKDVKIGQNNISIVDLQYGMKYQYQIVALYDSLNGEGKNSYIIFKGEFETESPIKLINMIISNNAISFECVKEEYVNIDNISLYDEDKDIQSALLNNGLNVSFDNLLSNYQYRIVIQYNYILNGNKITNYYSYEVKTLEKLVPTIKFNSVVAFNNNVFVYFEIKDLDLVGEIEVVNVYKDNVIFKEIKDIEYSLEKENQLIFEIEDTGEYYIELIYRYDLNDTLGAQFIKEQIKVNR